MNGKITPSGNSFNQRRYTEVPNSVMAGIKMREQQQVL